MKILVFPRDPNPYQELLYSNMLNKFKDIEYSYLISPVRSHSLWILFLIIPQSILFRLRGYQIFHLHWVFMFQITLNHPFFHKFLFRLFFSMYFLFFIFIVKLAGYRLVWTVHDLLPHESYFINDQMMSKLLSRLSDSKIVHSDATFKTMRNLGFDTANTNIIPIGNYIDVYQNNISQNKARAILKIPKGDFVFGFFGKIEKYKGIHTLVDTFNSLKLKNAKLLIAGSCSNENIRQFLKLNARNNPDILLKIEFIPDKYVQLYMNSTDIFVYPFTEVTSSSSVILAMSFGKPVIAARVGEICHFTKKTGYYYSLSRKVNNLPNYMKFAAKNKNKIQLIGKNAYHFIKSNQWRESSKLTTRLYKKLILSN